MQFDVEDFDRLRGYIRKKALFMYLVAGSAFLASMGERNKQIWLQWDRLTDEVTSTEDPQPNRVNLARCSTWRDEREGIERERAAEVYADDVLWDLHDRLRYGPIGPDWLPPDGAPRKEDTR